MHSKGCCRVLASPQSGLEKCKDLAQVRVLAVVFWWLINVPELTKAPVRVW